VLGGFASAVALAVVALVMAIESVTRLVSPLEIRFDEAIWVACIGLAVNVLSGVILHRAGHHHGHDHDHDHDHDHGHDGDPHHNHDHDRNHAPPGAHAAHGHPHHDHNPAALVQPREGDVPDHNLRAAYLHVVADALTSVLAIVALFAGKYLGLTWLDATMGLVGAALITRWAWGLATDSSAILLDRTEDAETSQALRRAVAEAGAGDSVSDLHVWQVAPGRLAAAVTIVSHAPRAADYYRHRLAEAGGLAHVTVEVNECRDTDCREPR
jgi:cation diffusion facilitator family transporter